MKNTQEDRDHSGCFDALAVDDFESYDLVIDARTPREFAEDHVPGAVNLPVVSNAEFAEVGTLHARSPHAAYVIGASYALRNIADHVEQRISHFTRESRFLVYCFRGGKRSRVWADTLRTIGYKTDVVRGGWKAYRSCVRAGLESLPSAFRYRVLSGLTGCGKTRLLQALGAEGCQVLDLEQLASHRGSLLGDLPQHPQPSQKWFDSQLFNQLRSFRPERPVWVEAESKKIGRVQLPDDLIAAIRSATPLDIAANIHSRVQLLKEDYPHFAAQPRSMVDLLQPLKPLVGGEELARWLELAEAGAVDQLFERVLTSHYDPSYRRSLKRAGSAATSSRVVHMDPTDPADVSSTARRLAATEGVADDHTSRD